MNYVLDADTFIRSKRDHYQFSFCPAYWDALLSNYGCGELGSIDKVRAELLKHRDDLSDWVRLEVPEAFFHSTADDRFQDCFGAVMQWAEGRDQYYAAALTDFASGADSWLVAFARVTGATIVTHEVSAIGSKANIKLPDAAAAHGVRCISPFTMLGELGVRFVLPG